MKDKLEVAEKNPQAAVEIYPAYAAAWFTLGRVYQQQQRTEDARLAFTKARDADSSYVLPYVELARLAALEKKWEEVADLTDRALALNPLDIPDGFFLNSLAYYNLKNLDAAERSARKAQRLDSLHRLPLGHLILARILQQKQDFAGEAEQLQYYLKYAPQAANAGQIRARLQELEKANGAVAGTQRPQQ
jgi:tetratricopeptide (TPR) repeat protein